MYNFEINEQNKEVSEGVNMSVENNHCSENGCSLHPHLLVVDGTPTWLHNIYASLDDPATICADAFVSTLYVLIYECGFTIIGGPTNPGLTFNINVMRHILDKNFLERADSSYKIYFTLSSFPNKCILIATPIGNIMVTNLFLPSDRTLLSCTFNMNDFIDTSGIYPKMKNSKELSFKFKNSLCEIRRKLINEETTDPKHILSLPTEILLEICNYLTARSYFNFSITCKHFYYTVFNDESVWSNIARLYLPCRRIGDESWHDFVMYQSVQSQSNRFLYPFNYPDYMMDEFYKFYQFDC